MQHCQHAVRWTYVTRRDAPKGNSKCCITVLRSCRMAVSDTSPAIRLPMALTQSAAVANLPIGHTPTGRRRLTPLSPMATRGCSMELLYYRPKHVSPVSSEGRVYRDDSGYYASVWDRDANGWHFRASCNSTDSAGNPLPIKHLHTAQRMASCGTHRYPVHCTN